MDLRERVDDLQLRYLILRLLQSDSDLLGKKMEEYSQGPYYLYYQLLRSNPMHGVEDFAEYVGEIAQNPTSIPVEVRSRVGEILQAEKWESLLHQNRQVLITNEMDQIIKQVRALVGRQRTCC